MSRFAVAAALACLLILLPASSAIAQVGGEAPPTTTQAPLRPFDPPLPEPVFIPDLVSDLVLTDFGGGLDVTPLTANPPATTPGAGFSIDWAAWADFALPAAIPMFIALALVGLTRIPRRMPEQSSVVSDN